MFEEIKEKLTALFKLPIKEITYKEIDYNRKSKLTGFITVEDDKFHSIDTPNGKVNFIEFIGFTDSELKALQKKQLTVKELLLKLGSEITDYQRDSVI